MVITKGANVVKKYIDTKKFERYIANIDLRTLSTKTVGEALEVAGVTTKQIKYFDEDENVWKVGEVIVDETDE